MIQVPRGISGPLPPYRYVRLTGMIPLIPSIAQVLVFSASDNCSWKKKGRQNVLFWPSINWVLKAPRAEPTSFRSSRKLCPEYKSIRMHTTSIHVRLQCSLWLLYQIVGHICIPVAGAFGAKVMDMTKGMLVRKLVSACWHRLTGCYCSDIPEGAIHISYCSTKCVPENVSLILRLILISPFYIRF